MLIIEKKINKLEYDLASQLHMSYKVIKSCVSGWGIPKYVAIKTITQMLHHLLHVNEIKVKWSPKHQLIVTTNNDRDIDNVNLVSWIIYPKERVKLSYWKVEKVSWVIKKSNKMRAMDQVLLSLTLHTKQAPVTS